MEMKVLNVAPKDVYVTIEISLESLKLLKEALSISEIKYNSKEKPEDAKAAAFLKDTFFPFLDTTIEDISKYYGS
jgi:hypothetical protein